MHVDPPTTTYHTAEIRHKVCDLPGDPYIPPPYRSDPAPPRSPEPPRDWHPVGPRVCATTATWNLFYVGLQGGYTATDAMAMQREIVTIRVVTIRVVTATSCS